MKSRRSASDVLSFETVYTKACRYCAYQERSTQEVMLFLKEKFALSHQQQRQCIEKLMEEGFLNERRFALLYAQSKFRQKQWGKLKIAFHLKQYSIDETIITEALENISSIEYESCLQKLLQQKAELISRQETDPWKRRAKLIRYAQQKGYESDLIQKLLSASE